jgi:hypothetical protein
MPITNDYDALDVPLAARYSVGYIYREVRDYGTSEEFFIVKPPLVGDPTKYMLVLAPFLWGAAALAFLFLVIAGVHFYDTRRMLDVGRRVGTLPPPATRPQYVTGIEDARRQDMFYEPRGNR